MIAGVPINTERTRATSGAHQRELMLVGLIVMTAIYWIFQGTPPARVDRWFRRLQLVSAAGYSLMHGANDAQKTMGIITGALVTGGYLESFVVPVWVILIAHMPAIIDQAGRKSTLTRRTE